MILRLEHLAPYLLYRLQMIVKLPLSKEETRTMMGIDYKYISIHNKHESIIRFNETTYTSWLTEVKPILNPLSNYTDILGKGINMLNIDVQDQIELCDFAEQKIGLSQISYGLYEIMCINHIDFNRLIEKGLAIDINTLK